ncbi:hypothetical protein J4G33_14875 [Actinotalea sp. BY-33]|uniref:Uncharacterized protein n=1 Tax=Actinotalea soli TaxID=2819234 RepID=A0A939LXJ9_9CELL|nr:hypothetical protein [Actinotalea soli]MBO1753092.1 hypothetical protein [Actinotalea soli]
MRHVDRPERAGDPARRSRRSRGLRFTEGFLLPFTGPADLGDLRRGSEVSPAQRDRADRLTGELRRVTGPDGRSYVVTAEPAEPPAGAPEPSAG